MGVPKTIALQEEEGSRIQEELLYSLCQLPPSCQPTRSLSPGSKTESGTLRLFGDGVTNVGPTPYQVLKDPS